MAVETGVNYFKLFEGQDVPLSEITRECPMMVETIRSLIINGKVIGQMTLEGDEVLWMPDRKIDPIIVPDLNPKGIIRNFR